MRLFGVVLIASGGALIFWVLRATVAGSPSVTSGSSSLSSPSTGGSASGNANAATTADSGSHLALDPNGNLYQIVSPYGGMSDQQKDDANRFAHNYPSGLAATVVGQ